MKKLLFILTILTIGISSYGQRVSEIVSSGDTIVSFTDTTYVSVAEVGVTTVTKAIRLKPILDTLISPSDTAAMLIPYVLTEDLSVGIFPGDTAAMLVPYIQGGDTAAMLIPYVLTADLTNDLAIGDTATMLIPYITRGDTAAMLTPYVLTADLTNDLAIADTATMLTPYITRGDTADMLLPNTTNISTIDGGVMTGIPNAEAVNLVFYDEATNQLYYSDTTGWQGGSGSVGIFPGDTANMLTPYITRGDTAAMLIPYVLTADLTNDLAIADTSSMLTPYITRGDTTDMLTPYITRGDTATMLSDYALLSEIGDTTIYTVCPDDDTTDIPITILGEQSVYLQYISYRDISGTVTKQFGIIEVGYDSVLDTTYYTSKYIGPDIGLDITANTTVDSIQLNIIVDNTNTNDITFGYSISNGFVSGGGGGSISDTAAMLTPYITRGDTATMLTPYITRGDTADMLSDYALLSVANYDTYYVSSSAGDDSNNGLSPSSAWETLTKVESESYVPGDQILFKRGDAWYGDKVQVSWSGDSDNPITFGAYGSGAKPILSGSLTLSTWTGSGPYEATVTSSSVWLVQENGIPLEEATTSACSDGDWYFDGGADILYYSPTTGVPGDHTILYSPLQNLFRIQDYSYITITDIHFEDFLQGISMGVLAGQTRDGISIEDCDFYRGVHPIYSNSGVTDGGTGSVIDGNYFYRCENGVQLYAPATYSYSGWTITDNEFDEGGTHDGTNHRDSDATGTEDYEAIGLQNISNSTISGNNVHDGYTKGIFFYATGAGLMDDNIVTRNIVINNGSTGFITMGDYGLEWGWNGNLVAYNQFINCGDTDPTGADAADTCAIHFIQDGGGSVVNKFVNNTIVSATPDAILFTWGADDEQYLDFKNNIITGYSRWAWHMANTKTELDMSNNMWETDSKFHYNGWYRSLDYVQTNTVWGDNSLIDDPEFNTVSDTIELQNTSPAINVGAEVGLSADYSSDPILGTPDMGAFENQYIMGYKYLDGYRGDLFVVDAGTYGNGNINATEHIQSKIDAAGNGTVYIPPGDYKVDSLRVGYNPSDGKMYTPSIKGAGWALDEDGNTGTILRSYVNKPIITIDCDTLLAYGGIIEGIFFWGLDDPDSTNQDGIRLLGPGHYHIRDNYIQKMGGYGIHFGNELPGARVDNDDIWTTTIQHNEITRNRKGGIKAMGLSGSAQVNAIDFIDNTIDDNYGPGIWTFGTNINILQNEIERNDSAGVWISSEGVEANNSANGITVADNYFEQNGGGSLLMEMGRVSGGSYDHTITGLLFEGNYILGGAIDSDKATADVTLRLENGSSAVRFLYDAKIGINGYSGTDPYVDLNDVGDKGVSVRVSGSQIATKYLGLRYSDVRGGDNAGFYQINHIPVTGLTTIRPRIYLSQTSAIDITSDPQIADGEFDGQMISIMGNSDTHTLTLDDGDGLTMRNSVALGSRDVIKFEWFNSTSTWVQTGYEDNGSASATDLEIGGDLIVTGNISGATEVTLDTDATVVLTAADCKNKARINNDADAVDYTLPTAEAGLVVVFYDFKGGVITIDSNTGDIITLDGTALDAADAIDSPGDIGNFIALMAIDDTNWITLGRSGTWIDGGTD